MARCLRYFCHVNGAAFVCTKHKDKAMMTVLRNLLYHHVFHTSSVRTVQLEHTRPLVVPAASDSLAAIGQPPSWLQRNTPPPPPEDSAPSGGLAASKAQLAPTRPDAPPPRSSKARRGPSTSPRAAPRVALLSCPGDGHRPPLVDGVHIDTPAERWRVAYEATFPPKAAKKEAQDLSLVDAEQFAEEAIDVLRRQKQGARRRRDPRPEPSHRPPPPPSHPHPHPKPAPW